MKPKISKTICGDDKLSYAKDHIVIPQNIIDCSAGYNPYGAPPGILEIFHSLTPSIIYEYPHGDLLQEAVVSFWSPYVKLGVHNIVLSDGTIDAIYLINTAFSAPGAALLAVAPQFSDYTTHAKFLNIACRPVYLQAENDYRIEAGELLERIDGSLSLVYLDTPNNPTGQTIPLDIIRAVLDKAARYDVCVIADEAYGDYMEEAQSAATLLNDYENLIVLRTFSKGYGLAGLRAGYILASEWICSNLNKISNPYTVSQPARIAAAAVLSDTGFIKACRTAIAKSKVKLRRVLGDSLRLAHTLDSCPICLLTHVDPDVDLEQEFLQRGILTYSGASFDGLGKNSVRLRMPHERECEALFTAVQNIK